MRRMMLGALIATVATFFIGFALHGSGLQIVAYGSLADDQAARVQQALKDNMPRAGSYIVPDNSSAVQTKLYQAGPIATVHFVPEGFPTLDPMALATWLVLAFAVTFLIGLGLWLKIRPSGSILPTVLIVMAAAAYIRLSEPILYHLHWTYFLYHFATDVLVLSTISVIIGRWFVLTDPQQRERKGQPPAIDGPPKSGRRP